MNVTYPGLFPCKALTAEEKASHKPNYPAGWSPAVYQPKSGLGLLYASPFEDKVRENFVHDGIEMEFVDYWPTTEEGKPFNYVRAAYTAQVGMGSYKFHLVLVHLSQIDLAALKKMEVWNILSEEDKQKLETNAFVAPKIEPKDAENTSTSSKGRKRNPEYADLPRELKCSTPHCDGKMPYISPTILVAKATEKGITPEEYANTWKCAECEPRKRGRAASEKWLNLPREITCPCGFVLKQHPSMTTKLAEAMGKSFDEYVKDYRCRKCKPETTTTTTTRGRKMSPDSPWFGKAKELKCACGKVQPQHASITDAQAKKAGVSFDDYVASWKCINCRPVGAKRVRFGKAPNPNFAGIPKETACVSCTKVVKLVPSNIIEKAEILGMTVDELIKNYRCRSCGGKISRKKAKVIMLV